MQTKKLVFTAGETELLKNLCNGCNIAMYRTGQIRLRDRDHNPVRNISSVLFEAIRKYTVQIDGLFYINEEMKQNFSDNIKNG